MNPEGAMAAFDPDPRRYRRSQLCALADLALDRFKTLRHRHQLAIYPDAQSDPDRIIDVFADLDAIAERRGHGRFNFGDAVMLDAQFRLADHGLSLEQAARVVRDAPHASARRFHNPHAWVMVAHCPGLFLVKPTTDENGELGNIASVMGSLDHVHDFLAKGKAPLAMATIVNLSLSCDRVLARAREHGIATPFDEGAT